MNKIILSIETSTNICSVSLFKNQELLCLKEDSDRKHSALLGLFVDQIFKEVKVDISEIDAIALSMGPGSYTGLRIGLSFAKGMAFSLNKPIITVDTIDSLSYEIDAFDYMIAIHAYSNYFFFQKYKNNFRFEEPFFDKMENINYSNNIYGYGPNKSNFLIKKLIPSSIKIANYAYKNYNKCKYDDIKLIKPNYIKSIEFDNKF
tara:strand:- start:800 stop:1411 length:612 start_codon:yes stop_codon:yes gene_type:complete